MRHNAQRNGRCSENSKGHVAGATQRRPTWLLAAAAVVFVLFPSTAIRAQPRRQAPPPTEEQLVEQAIERTLQKHGAEVHRCFEQALADRLDVAGKIEVEVEIGAAGRVSRSKIASKAEDVSPQLSACVLASAAQWVVLGVEAGSSLVLPFSFQGQISQFIVKTADAPERGPPASKGRGGVRIAPAFMVKILGDEANVRAVRASLTLLTVGPASRVATHRHPRSAKLLYVLKGHARLLGPPGTAPEKLDEGTAVFLPVGYPHAIENVGRQADAVFLQAFNPPGPERVYRDPADVQGRADFEVIRDSGKAKAAPGVGPGTRPVVVLHSQAPPTPNTAATERVLLDPSMTGSAAFGLSILEFAADAALVRHSHPGAEEFLYVLSGGGTLTVGSETMPFAAAQSIHIPGDQPHALKVGMEPTVLVQIFAPGPKK